MAEPRRRDALASARLYLVAPCMQAEVLRAVLEAGVGVLQLREKDAEAVDVLRTGEVFGASARKAGVPFIVNDRPDLAWALGADGVHLGQEDLPPEFARRLLGPGTLIGRSTHSPGQIDRALADYTRGDVDYIAVGPVHETPTKQGRPAVGLALVRYAAGHVPDSLPWFAIGGIDTTNVNAVVDAGARRIVVVRAVTRAANPPAAVRSLLERLPGG